MQTAEYTGFVTALCDPAAPLPAGLQCPADASLEDRFAVYRNNVHASLVDALAERFPIVRAQVGDEFFRAMARVFVATCKPAVPLLGEYGDSFPQFVAHFGPAASLPWLPDMAALECAWTESWAAADASACKREVLVRWSASQLAQARIRAHPAARLIRSAWPVADLWEAHQHAQPDLSALAWQAQNVLITRPAGSVLLQRLSDTGALFAAALLRGERIGAAAEQAPGCDAGSLLGHFIDWGMIMEITQ